MIKEIEIENYKSIDQLTIPLGRINVFIGENGAGKSNILEIIALAGAAAADKLDNEFLSSRGIRVTRPEHMRPSFPGGDAMAALKISIKGDQDTTAFYVLRNDNEPYSKWHADGVGLNMDDLFHLFDQLALASPENIENFKKISSEFFNKKQILEVIDSTKDFVIYSPENSLLRLFEREGQIEPLGINGEGLLRLLAYYATEPDQPTLKKVKQSLTVLNWFEDFQTVSESQGGYLAITDRYLSENVTGFDHKSTNEGFFFLLFYFLLFNSKLTPKFFAVDNIDASLNPKLCEKLMLELAQAAKDNDKQVILTTHNPSILDGLDLEDDEQRLFVVSRGAKGNTRVQRIVKPVVDDAAKNPRLSELFISGAIGGLSKGF